MKTNKNKASNLEKKETPGLKNKKIDKAETKNKDSSEKLTQKKTTNLKAQNLVNKNVPPPRVEEPSEYNLNSVELDFDNEVYDEADIASALEMGFIAQALEAHKSKVAPETHPDFDGESCLDCGDEIPKVRLSMGKIRCVYCQEALEKKNKLHGK